MRSVTPVQVGHPNQFNNGAEGQPDEATWDIDAGCAQLGSVPDGLAAYDTALRCLHVSDTVTRYGFGRRPDEIVGHTLCEVAAPDIARAVEPLLRHVLETEEPLVNIEISGERSSAPGKPWHWLGSIYPLRNSIGKMMGVGSLGMDITEGRRAEGERAEPVSRERSAEQRLAFLAEASQLLASSLDYQTILRRVAHLAVPILGEWCAVHALEGGGIRPVARAWADSTDEDATHGRNSWMVVALRARGRTLGVLSFGARGDRRYGPEDLALAEDLAGRCAVAVDNARLHAQAERRLRELEALYRADEALHQSLRLDEVLQALVGVATDILEADKSAVLLWDSKRQQLVVGAARGLGSAALPLMVFAPGEGITGRAAANGEPIVVHDMLTDPRIPAHLHGLVKAESIRSLVCVPIKASAEVVGVFNLIFTVPRVFNADDKRLVLALAQRAALAITNARLYEQAQEAIQAREEVLAATSHQLRNPLGNIKGFVSTLQRTDVDWDEATRRDFLSDIEREADRLAEFVDDLLDLARIDDAGVHIGTRARAGLNALVRAGLDRVRHMLVGREVHVRIPDELPAVEVDAARVEHVVANLVENAAKYTPADTPIRVTGGLIGDHVELAVEDEGPGIAPEHLDRIFDRFFRGRVALNVPGTGLGLAICRAIAQAEGGSIWAENRPSGGARFVVALPLS
jgi:K+-sensing histidine kinase KdpD